MSFEPKTLSEHIDCLAHLTGAPRSFVLQVKELFSRKGISLDADASPYLHALEEAFHREESIRANANLAQRNITSLADNFNRISRSYVRQLETLKKMRTGMRRIESARPRGRRTRVPGAGNGLVLRQEHDYLPMVPGPEETQ